MVNNLSPKASGESLIPKLLFAVSVALLFLMPSSRSIWVDEAYNARFAGLSSFEHFLQLFLGGHFSENQMPFGMFYSWLGGRIFGTTELALRSINLLWGAITIYCFFQIGKNVNLPWLPLFAVVQPFLWYYMDEARPYAMQIAAGALLLLSMIRVCDNCRREARWLVPFVTGAIILCSSSLLGTIPFTVITGIFFGIFINYKYLPGKSTLYILAGLSILLLLFALFYIWTIVKGASGAKLWVPGIGNIVFSIYDLLGFSGLGPSRIGLREAARGGSGDLLHLFANQGITLGALALIYAIISIFAVTSRQYSRKLPLLCFLVITGTFALIVIAALVMKFPFWARHLSAIFPFLVLQIALCFDSPFSRNVTPRILLLMATMALLLFSSLNIRFNPRLAKDEYRQAAKLALQSANEGKTVWWAADSVAGEYYGISSASAENKSPVFLVVNRDVHYLSKLPDPEIVVLSKPDIYDSQGELQELLMEKSYSVSSKLPAMTIWRKADPDHSRQ